MRVLFVIPGAGEGNSMIFARRQAEQLGKEGVEVRLFFVRSRTSPKRLASEFRRYRQDLKTNPPDLIHAHFGTVTAAFAGLGAGRIPLVITYRGSDLNPRPGRLNLRGWTARVLSQLAALKASRIVCVSQQLRSRLWWRQDRVTVLASGVDPSVFRPEPRSAARERLGWPETQRIVLFNAGRDPRIKRLDLAGAAIGVARNALPELRWEVLDGSVAPEIVPAMMNAADCLLLTSDQEGSPTVVQEALACGLPIVTVPVGDVRERLEDVVHTRIVERTPQALGAAIVQIVRVPVRTDGHRKIAEFSAPNIAARLRAVYQEVLG